MRVSLSLNLNSVLFTSFIFPKFTRKRKRAEKTHGIVVFVTKSPSMALSSNFTFSSFSPSQSHTKNPSEHSFFRLSFHQSTCMHCRIPICSQRNSLLQAAVSTSSSDKTLSDIQISGIIACLRAKSPELAWEAACAALNGGVTVLEIVMSSPGVLEVLRHLVVKYPEKTIGVGTVLNAKDAKSAIECGAKFLMSPAIVKDVMDYISGSPALYIPGVMTPTEILSAYNAGAKMVKELALSMWSAIYVPSRNLEKVYPISAVGGTKYVAAVKKPFPHIPLVASQGITLDLIEEYIAQGAAAVVLSDAIFLKLSMDERNFKVIYQLASTAARRARESVER